jgi:hypothetical protein
VLGEHPIQPVLLAAGLGAARGFYHDLLSLEIVGESDRHIVFRCGGGTQLAVTKSTAGTRRDLDPGDLAGPGPACGGGLAAVTRRQGRGVRLAGV